MIYTVHIYKFINRKLIVETFIGICNIHFYTTSVDLSSIDLQHKKCEYKMNYKNSNRNTFDSFTT